MPEADIHAIERLFRGLADRTRLRILNLMAGREICVCYFVEILDLPQPTISRHLAYLRRTGIVAARRDRKWMHYRIVPPADAAARQLLKETLRWLETEKEMCEDRRRMSRACCAPQTFVKLQTAPAPNPLVQFPTGSKMQRA